MHDQIAARWTARAPGRVNLIGEHVDYNDGWVLPMAIEREIVIRATQRPDQVATFASGLLGESFTVPLDNPTGVAVPAWGRYLQGVLIEYQRATGAALPGFDATIESTIPPGGGLSSSAALCVAAVTLFDKMTDCEMPPLDKALLCQKVEHEYAGVPCGLMDQMASVMCRAGHLLLLDCRNNETTHVPFDDSEFTVLITNSGVSHALADGAYAERRAQCAAVLRQAGLESFRDLSEAALDKLRPDLDGTLYRRARHVFSENRRTLGVVEALAQGDWAALGEHLYASHESLARDYEVSCPELDFLVTSAREIGPAGGVIGARMTGGGFGGSTITLVRRDYADSVVRTIRQQFRAAFGHEAAAFVTRAAAGAS
jgi:galactokinase